MPVCSIVGCRKPRTIGPLLESQQITLHRLPTVASKRKQWLDIIGEDNINTTTKNVFICSLHFEDSCFNRTMKIIKLRDDVLPSPSLLPNSRTGSCDTSIQIKEEESMSHLCIEPDPLSIEKPIHRIPMTTKTHNYVDEPVQPMVQTSSSLSEIERSEKYLAVTRELKNATDKIAEKNLKCSEHIKKIKRLHEKIRRQNITIDKLKNNVKYLKTLKLVNGKNVVQKRRVEKAKLAKRKKAKEEMSSSKFTVLHFLAPNIAYEFVRR